MLQCYTEVANLDVNLDSTLSFQSHIKSITTSAFYHLKNISRLQPSLPEPVAETLIHAGLHHLPPGLL